MQRLFIAVLLYKKIIKEKRKWILIKKVLASNLESLKQ